MNEIAERNNSIRLFYGWFCCRIGSGINQTVDKQGYGAPIRTDISVR
jgi:hypothetical protein